MELSTTGQPVAVSIGNIRATNTGTTPVILRSVALVGGDNIADQAAYVVRMESEGSGTYGVGFPVPPPRSDVDWERLEPIWNHREALTGAVVDPGELVNLIVPIAAVDGERCARLNGVEIGYTAGGSTYTVPWNTGFRLTGPDGDLCGSGVG